MSHYRRRPLIDPEPSEVTDVPAMLVREAGIWTRKLMPFPGLSSQALLDAIQAGPLTATAGDVASPDGALPATISEQVRTLVPRASSILDEEMARGVLSAHETSPSSRTAAAPASMFDGGGGSLLKELHTFVDRFAALMPQKAAASPAAQANHDTLPRLRNKLSVTPGQSVTLSMHLHNQEARAVRLTPRVTDLLGDTGGTCISAHCITLSASQVQMAPGEKLELSLVVTPPAGCTDGCYSGLLVIAGQPAVRALIIVDVAHGG